MTPSFDFFCLANAFFEFGNKSKSHVLKSGENSGWTSTSYSNLTNLALEMADVCVVVEEKHFFSPNGAVFSAIWSRIGIVSPVSVLTISLKYHSQLGHFKINLFLDLTEDEDPQV